MDNIATRDNENVIIHQRGQFGSKVHVVFKGLRGVDGELNDGYVGLGKHVSQDRPRAVIDPPRRVIERYDGRLRDLGHLAREIWRTRSGVVEVEEFLREAVEVVDDSRLSH